MEKNITRIVLTGGPAAGKTTLVSRILKSFGQEAGWRVITIPETATDLISGFGIKPFDNCMNMLQFQDFVITDQLHKERLALNAAQVVPEENILILYDRALLDDKAYISDEEFAEVIKRIDGRDEDEILSGYDAVIHLVSCAKGAEYAYNLGNTARSESIEHAVEMDDRTLRAWGGHRNLRIIDNSVDFEDKINRAMHEIYRFIGKPEPATKKKKYLIQMPCSDMLRELYGAKDVRMEQIYLTSTFDNIERRVRKQYVGSRYMYFYAEKHRKEDGVKWDTEHSITEKEYKSYLLGRDCDYDTVAKTKYCFVYDGVRYEIDIYPFCTERAVLLCYSENMDVKLPPNIEIIEDISKNPAYKNRHLAKTHKL